MSSTTETNFGNFYNSSPAIIILDKRGKYYNFPSNTYSNGAGGAPCSESDSKNYANGRKFGNFRDGDPWTSTWMVNMTNYTSDGNSVSTVPEDNAWDEDSLSTLNNNAKDNIPGYKLKSGGSYNNNSRDYIVADRGVGRYNFAFAVYIKKSDIDFFNDFINLGGTVKTKFLRMASDNAKFGNQRYESVPTAACNDSSMPSDGRNNCNAGAAQWCRDDPNGRIWQGNTNQAITSSNNPRCFPYVNNGSLDDVLSANCNNNNIYNAFCNDIRKTSGSNNIKNILNSTLATSQYCGNDANINSSGCVDVKNACSAANAALNDTTIANYKCNTLVKNLNDSNKITMLTSTFPNFTALSAIQKNTLAIGFNTVTSTAVEDALCALATNQNDKICSDYLSSNFGSLVKTTDNNPVLIMYFAGDGTNNLFTVPAGMDFSNSLRLTFNKTTGINVRPAKTLNTTWYSKLYVYITPSSIDDYLFKINADDDARLYLNNTLIIDAWGKGCCKDYVAPSYINLNPINGPYLLYIEFRDIGGSTANLNVTYTTRSSSTQTYSDFIILPSTVSTSGTSPIANLIQSRLYISKFNPYITTSEARLKQSVTYCTTNNRFATDTNCLGTATNGYTGINNRYISESVPFASAILDYCSDPTENRFATDTSFCANPNYKSYTLKTNNVDNKLNTSIRNYCIDSKNNTYATGTNTSYCKTTDNNNTANYTADGANMNMNLTYAKTLRDARLAYITNAIDNSLNATNNTKGTISQDVQDYIRTDYPNIQKVFGDSAYPNSNIIPSTLYPYCENVPDITSNQLCNTIYTAYVTDPNIVQSQQRITDFKDGIITNAFMGKSNNPNATIAAAQNAKYIAERDSPDKFAKYIPYAINYCSTGDNIVTPECQTYYDNVRGVISNGINTQYNNAAVKTTSPFTNKESFCDNNCNNECDSKCDNECDSKCDNEYDNECDDKSNDKNNYSNSLYIFLWFLFIIVLVISLGSLSNYSKTIYSKPYMNHLNVYSAY